MKKNILFLIFLFSTHSHSQSKGTYLINKELEITNINFEKSLKNTYSKIPEKSLTGLHFSLRKKIKSEEKECYLIRTYNYEADRRDLEKTKELVDIKYFYELVDKLNVMKKDNLTEDFNVIDGMTSTISFSGNNYSIRFSDNWESETKTDFYELFKYVWNNYNK